MIKRHTHALWIAGLCGFSTIFAAPTSLNQTKHQLQKVEHQINQLQQSLHHEHDKRSVLTKNLQQNEREMRDNLHQLQVIQHDLALKKQAISQLQNQLKNLTEQRLTCQKQLALHIQARYKVSEYQPLKWILNQNSPYTITRILTYYQYLLRSDQSLIEQAKTLEQAIQQKQITLQETMQQQQQLMQQLTEKQYIFNQKKLAHTNLLQTLNQTIRTKQKSLANFEQNRSALTQLLKTLSVQRGSTNFHGPLVLMKRKLPRPVDSTNRSAQKLNQGVLFPAQEGQPVHAVLPGKVLFSHWLKGYGLLLIVDHGRGYMSLYAHNKMLYKRSGDYVRQGEVIAAVGHSGVIRENGLYFEIRRLGKAVPPLQWLA